MQTMARVIATRSGDSVYLLETRREDGLGYGRVYDSDADTLYPEMLVASIAARGYWDEVDPAKRDHVALVARLGPRL